MINLDIIKAKPFPVGVTVLKDSVQFTFACEAEKCGLILTDKKTFESFRIPFEKEYRIGYVNSLRIMNLDINKYSYNFYCDDKIVTDRFANLVYGNEKFGTKDESYSLSGGIVYHDSYDWGNDIYPCTPYDNSVFYLIHVRGFTAHSSSKVKHKGTFTGVLEKVDYLKDLGITALELMPAYEFEEYEHEYTYEPNDVLKDPFYDSAAKINYWGYKKAFYYAPKFSYCATDNPVKEFKDFISIMHLNGIEVIMQFYFPDDISGALVYEVLRYWLYNYHVDGFRLKGSRIPISYLASDPLFMKTKLLYDYIPENEIYSATTFPSYENLCVYSDDYMYRMRRVLKGDEDTLKELVNFVRLKPEKAGKMNYITNYYGFTLNDLYSYDKKHNETNGENNADGSDYNFSWNCGVEGKSRKSSVLNLRKRMIKNAVFLLMTSKGTPLITSGDEFCKTQLGNNNPYCQDNEISYVNWNLNSFNKEIFEFTKFMIKLRKEDLSLVFTKDFSMLDRNHIGYPDLSYHGEEAWKSDLSNYNRHLGMMYSEYDKNNKSITLYYLAYNYYWKNIAFALPSIPSDVKWNLVVSTGQVNNLTDENDGKSSEKYELEQRSSALFKVVFNKNKK